MAWEPLHFPILIPGPFNGVTAIDLEKASVPRSRPRLLQPLDYSEFHLTVTLQVTPLPWAVGALYALVQVVVTQRAHKRSWGRVLQSYPRHCRSRHQEMKKQTWF